MKWYAAYAPTIQVNPDSLTDSPQIITNGTKNSRAVKQCKNLEMEGNDLWKFAAKKA
jgi:hypothetical protein